MSIIVTHFTEGQGLGIGHGKEIAKIEENNGPLDVSSKEIVPNVTNFLSLLLLMLSMTSSLQ